MKKGTLFGFVLSIFVILTTLCYFVKKTQQYATNQIEPNFRSQSFINDDEIDIPLNSDFVTFKFDYGDNTDLYKARSQNKTFLVYYAFFYYQKADKYDDILIPVFECTNPKLLGFYCLDLSVISNTTLVKNTEKNILSQIQLNTYGCLDTDDFKKNYSQQLYKPKRDRQYENEVSYRNALVYTVANQQIVTQIKAQKQITSVKQGLIVQTQSIYSSTISYAQQDQPIDRIYALNYIGIGRYNCLVIYSPLHEFCCLLIDKQLSQV
ncbi:hypothetical protein ABPG72_010698 [Tetrahymena utriculariae]